MKPSAFRSMRTCVLFHMALAAWAAVAAAAHNPAAANTPAVAQALQHQVGVADTVIDQLEQAIDKAMEDLEKADKTMHDRIEQAETTDAKIDAIENRLEDKTSVDKGELPGTDAKPEEFEEFLDNASFFRPYFEKALKLRALLRALETWKELRKAWADLYEALTGREVARVPVRNACGQDRVAYSATPVSTNDSSEGVPRMTLTGNLRRDLAAGLSGPDADWTSPGRVDDVTGGDTAGGKIMSDRQWFFGASGSMGGAQVDFSPSPASRVAAADTRSLDATLRYDFYNMTKLDLSYSYGSAKVDPESTAGVQFGCPPQGTDVGFAAFNGAMSYTPGLFSGGTAKVKAECHATRTFGLDDPPDGIAFDRSALRGAYICMNDPEAQRKLTFEWRPELMDRGIHVDPASQKISYFPENAGARAGLCLTEWSRYESIQCPSDLTDPFQNGWEIGQPRQILPAIVGVGSQNAVQTAQAPAARETGRRIAQLPNDRYFHSTGSLRAGLDDQWGLKRIGFAAAPPDGRGSLWPRAATPVLVAVVDSGIDASHPDLAGALWANPKEVGGNGKDDDGNGYVDDVFGWNFIDKSNNTWDNNGHGTFVAGIIAARTHDVIGIAGVNPWARILPVKVTDFDGKGDHLHVSAGIYYAARMGARVINVSIGGRRLTLGERYAIDFAVKRGALVVVAAGNTGIDIADFSPAAIEGAITVAATDDKDRRAGFSNFGAQIDIAAPGVDILSLRARQTDLMAFFDKDYKPGSNIVGAARMFYRLSGTSFAAPYVSGVASLLFSINPSLTAEQVKRMILQSARDIEIPGFDRLTGYGLLDARAALAADPDHFVEARISGVSAARKDGELYIVPSGTASADRMKRAWIEIGKGKDPTAWARGSEDTTGPVQSGPLALVPAKLFSPGLWTIRLVVEHADGSRREARHELNLR